MRTIFRVYSAGVLLCLLLSGNACAGQPLVDAGWLAQHLTDANLVVLDIRNTIDGGSQALYAAGHIPGAVYSNYLTAGWRVTRDGVPGMLPPVPQLEQLIGQTGISNKHHVVIVPGGVSAVDYGSATRVYWTFKVLGHDNLSILNGGYAGWVTDPSRPVEQGINPPQPATFTAHFRPHLLATRDDVAQAIASGVQRIDNRPPPQFAGQGKHPAAKRAGAIPGAKNIPQGQFIQASSGRFADAETLAKLWQAQGVSPTEAQITYCNTGHWASLGWFAASELLGNSKVRLYDGSMTEWSAHPELPMTNTP